MKNLFFVTFTASILICLAFFYSFSETANAGTSSTNTVVYSGWIKAHGQNYNLIKPKVENITKVTIDLEFSQIRTMTAENMMDSSYCFGGIGRRTYDIVASEGIELKGNAFDTYDVIGTITNNTRWTSGDLPNFDGVQDYAGPSGITEEVTTTKYHTIEYTDPLDFADFEGTSMEQFYLRCQWVGGSSSGYTYYNLPSMDCSYLTGSCNSPAGKRWVKATVTIEHE